MRKLHWGEYTSAEFRALDPGSTIAVLPVAAHEQHGPHLPVSTDATLGEGMLAELYKKLPDDLNIIVLPMAAVGKSNEHIRSPGTLTFSADLVIRMWAELGESVHRAGLRKLVMINSHGGNSEALAIVARELRVRFDMLAVHTQWRRFGLPDGLYTPTEAAHGIHAGDIETSLMLYFRPDLVRREEMRDFPSNAVRMAETFKRLSPTGPFAFGWMSGDLNPLGAVGDASLATAEKGRLTAEHQVDGFIELLRDVRDFRLAELT